MTMHTSSSSPSGSTTTHWTLRGAIGRSTPGAVVVATGAAIASLAGTAAAQVPPATGVTLAALLPAVLVDVIERRLPNRLVAAAATVGLAVLLAHVLAIGRQAPVVDPVLGALAMGGPLLAMHLVAPSAIGFGDVKLALVAGAALGLVDPVAGLVALAIGSAGAAVVGAVRRRSTVAFGPGLLGGAIVTLLLAAGPLDPMSSLGWGAAT